MLPTTNERMPFPFPVKRHQDMIHNAQNAEILKGYNTGESAEMQAITPGDTFIIFLI